MFDGAVWPYWFKGCDANYRWQFLGLDLLVMCSYTHGKPGVPSETQVRNGIKLFVEGDGIGTPTSVKDLGVTLDYTRVFYLKWDLTNNPWEFVSSDAKAHVLFGVLVLSNNLEYRLVLSKERDYDGDGQSFKGSTRVVRSIGNNPTVYSKTAPQDKEPRYYFRWTDYGDNPDNKKKNVFEIKSMTENVTVGSYFEVNIKISEGSRPWVLEVLDSTPKVIASRKYLNADRRSYYYSLYIPEDANDGTYQFRVKEQNENFWDIHTTFIVWRPGNTTWELSAPMYVQDGEFVDVTYQIPYGKYGRLELYIGPKRLFASHDILGTGEVEKWDNLYRVSLDSDGREQQYRLDLLDVSGGNYIQRRQQYFFSVAFDVKDEPTYSIVVPEDAVELGVAVVITVEHTYPDTYCGLIIEYNGEPEDYFDLTQKYQRQIEYTPKKKGTYCAYFVVEKERVDEEELCFEVYASEESIIRGGGEDTYLNIPVHVWSAIVGSIVVLGVTVSPSIILSKLKSRCSPIINVFFGCFGLGIAVLFGLFPLWLVFLASIVCVVFFVVKLYRGR
jgi:hypothetical protein